MGNPERFIASNVEASWLIYLSSISRQGTWTDHIIIQAVADVENSCNININKQNKQTWQNKQPENLEINHCKKREKEKAVSMRQYRSAKASPEENAKHNEYQRNKERKELYLSVKSF